MREEAEPELEFEEDLCNYLCSDERKRKWTYINANTTEKLWDNFRDILNALNKDNLDHSLTNYEFNQVKSYIQKLKTPYEAGRFIYGVGGKCQIQVIDERNQSIFLTIFDKNNVQNNIYQLTKQVNKEDGDEQRNRRFDVTLLINGLPILQIEEKKDGVDSKTAVRQMHEYIRENKYSDIFSTLQILIAMTPHDIWYMANSTDEDFSEDFAFRWKKDGDNSQKLLDWKDFCDSFLNPPFAYKMATEYTILDNDGSNPSLKVMRYYQVYATRNVINKLKEHNFEDTSDENKKVGYIWHTTGSGKTISSFKVAFLASRLPKVKKVIFVVDRVALTNQTYKKYSAYVPDGDNESIMSVDNTNDLKKKLESNSNVNIVVTTIQMLNNLFISNPDYCVDKETVLIVDEAHRSTNGDQMKNLKKGFTRSAWIGFTGTPDFDDDTNNTQDVFGPQLHVYTIKNAIEDKNVLGFHVEFKNTIDEDEYLYEYEKTKNPNLTDEQIEKRVKSYSDENTKRVFNKNIYSEGRDETDQHIEQVVNDVLLNWNRRSNNRKFNAILTAKTPNGSSKGLAYKYYQEFKKQLRAAKKNGDKNIPSNLKIAITFSPDGKHTPMAIDANSNLVEVLKEYNQEFGTTYETNQIKEYFSDLTSRLDKSVRDGKYLDLVIVVDQLLTGFDAPQLNTLYVDRLLEDSNLIQAYSRTNRVYDMLEKPFGNVVNYRFPKYSKEYMNAALEKFSNPNTEKSTNESDIPALVESYDDLKEGLRQVVNELSILTDDFSSVPETESNQKDAYLKILKYNRLLEKMKQYEECSSDSSLFDDISLTKDQRLKLTGSIFYDLKGKMQSVDDDAPFVNGSWGISTLDSINVDADYIKNLLAQYVNNNLDGMSDYDKKQTDKKDFILSYINSLSNKEADLIVKYINNPNRFHLDNRVNKYNVLQVLSDLLENDSADKLDGLIDTFINKFGLQELHAKEKLEHYVNNPNNTIYQNAVEDIKNEAVDYYRDNSTDNKIRNYDFIDYVNQFDSDLDELFEEEKEKM